MLSVVVLFWTACDRPCMRFDSSVLQKWSESGFDAVGYFPSVLYTTLRTLEIEASSDRIDAGWTRTGDELFQRSVVVSAEHVDRRAVHLVAIGICLGPRSAPIR